MEQPPDTSTISPLGLLLDAALRQALYESALTLLSRPLADPSPEAGLLLATELRPRAEDYARVFAPGVVATAQRCYETLFLAPHPIKRDPEQTVLRLFVASAADLRQHGPQALEFPGGYSQILDFLLPDSIWVHWKYVAPHRTAGMAYDGLVRIDDRWVWFPKPYRFLHEALRPASTLVAEGGQEGPATDPGKGVKDEVTQDAIHAITHMWKE